MDSFCHRSYFTVFLQKIVIARLNIRHGIICGIISDVLYNVGVSNIRPAMAYNVAREEVWDKVEPRDKTFKCQLPSHYTLSDPCKHVPYGVMLCPMWALGQNEFETPGIMCDIICSMLFMYDI